jgi:exosortase/archaeosortase family protein
MTANRRKRLPKKRAKIKQANSITGTIKGWPKRHPVFLFLAAFVVLLGALCIFARLTPFYERYCPYNLRLNARLSGHILKFFGQDITIYGASIFSPAFSVTIEQQCNAARPIALFVCAVLAFPAPFSKKIAGMVTGTLLLIVINLVRIVTVFFVGVYLPWAFQTVHLDIWTGLFIFFAIFLWILWLLWTRENQMFRQKL